MVALISRRVGHIYTMVQMKAAFTSILSAPEIKLKHCPTSFRRCQLKLANKHLLTHSMASMYDSRVQLQDLHVERHVVHSTKHAVNIVIM